MRAFFIFARNDIVKPRVGKSTDGFNQLLVNATHCRQRFSPCGITRIGNWRKILFVGESDCNSVNPPKHGTVPGGNVEHEFPDCMGMRNWTSGSLRRRNALENFK